MVVVALVAVLVVGYAVAAILTRAQWTGTATQDGTRVAFDARAADGSDPGAKAMERARERVAQRFPDAEVTVDGDALTVTVPSDESDRVRELGDGGGQLLFRPVIHAIPSQSAPTQPTPSAAPKPPPVPPEQRIADERKLRQSTDQSIQVLALQFQATRCGDEDVLAGHDDPDLPLVTCSQDGSVVYLLDGAIITGDQITNATSGFAEQSGQYVVSLEFDETAAESFARFTESNVGTQVGYVVDTAVVSAPEIREAIPGGRVEISGQFTKKTAAELARTVANGSLGVGLTVSSSTPVQIPADDTGSTAWRVGLGAGGAVVLLAVLGALGYLVYFVRANRRARAGAGWPT